MQKKGKKGALPSAHMPSKVKTIGDTQYRVHRMKWWDLLEQLDLAEKVFGSAMLEVAQSFSVGNPLAILDQAGGTNSIFTAIFSALGNLSGPDGRRLLLSHGAQTMIYPEGHEVRLVHAGDNSDNLDTWFGQNPGHLVEWLMFCFEVQFWDFFATPLSRAKGYLKMKGFMEEEEEAQ